MLGNWFPSHLGNVCCSPRLYISSQRVIRRAELSFWEDIFQKLPGHVVFMSHGLNWVTGSFLKSVVDKGNRITEESVYSYKSPLFLDWVVFVSLIYKEGSVDLTSFPS